MIDKLIQGIASLEQSEERVVFDPDTKTVSLGVAFCPFLNKPCKPKGCPFANDPKYRKEDNK